MSKANKGQRRREFNPEFKRDVLKMLESGRSALEIAKSLGIESTMIYRWRKESRNEGKNPSITAHIDFDEEKVAMAKRIRELEMDRDILKKALGIFSR